MANDLARHSLSLLPRVFPKQVIFCYNIIKLVLEKRGGQYCRSPSLFGVAQEVTMEHKIKSAIIAAIWAVTNEVHDIETAADIATAQIMRELEKPTYVSQA